MLSVILSTWCYRQEFLFQVGAESLGVLAKALTTVYLLVRPDCRHLGLHIFSLAQLAFAIVKTATFYAYFVWLVATADRDSQPNSDSNCDKTQIPRSAKNKLPSDFPFQSLSDFFPSTTVTKHSSPSSSTSVSPSSSVPLVDPDLASLSWTFVKQTVVKQLLTEGERYVMTFFDALSFADQVSSVE